MQPRLGTFQYDQQVSFNDQTGTSYTVVLSDENKVIVINNGGANTVTVPPDSTTDFPIGAQISIWQYGSGQTSIVAGSGVTIHTASTLNLRAQYSIVTLIKYAADEWAVIGDLASS